MEKITCPQCNQPTSHYTDLADHFLTQETFKLYTCNSCSFLFTYPVPEDLSPYYDSQDYLSHHTEKKNFITLLYNKVRRIQLNNKLKLLRSINAGDTLLDYGCGSGTFLKYCKQHGYQCTGLEPDADARRYASESTGLSIYNDLSAIDSSTRFDIITLWHVLEHVPKPSNLVSTLNKHLSGNGALIIAVPNFNSHDAKHYQSYWAGYDVPRHLYHFSKSSIQIIANKNGMIVESIKPMIFDSFYVSLLSEKYRHKGILSYPAAFIEGITSNIKAFKTGEFSSLIYVLRKDA